jgi:hypothetical protein
MLNDVKNRESIPVIKDYNSKRITDPIEKANSPNPYYAPLFSGERNNPQIQLTESGKPFTISIYFMSKQSAVEKKKSVRTDGIPGKIL